jgi:hypothetical protein
MSVEKQGSRKRLDLKTLAAMVGLDRTGDAVVRPGDGASFARFPDNAWDSFDSPHLDLHNKLSDLLAAARSVTPDIEAETETDYARRNAEIPKFLSRALDDYAISSSANGTPPKINAPLALSPARSLTAKIGEVRATVSAAALFCLFGASVGTLSALGVTPRQADRAYTTAPSPLVPVPGGAEAGLQRFEFVAPDNCAGQRCRKLTLEKERPEGSARAPAPAADAALRGRHEPTVATRVEEPEAEVKQSGAPDVRTADLPPPSVAVEDGPPNVEIAALEPALQPPEGFDPLSVVILRGLPVGSTLSAGTQLSGTDWMVPAAEIDNVIITLPANVPPRIRATLELVRRTGQPTVTLTIELRHTPGERTADLGEMIAKDMSKAAEAPPPVEVRTGAEKPIEQPPETAKAEEPKPAPEPDSKPKDTAAAEPPRKPKRPTSRKKAAARAAAAAAKPAEQARVVRAAPKPQPKAAAAMTIQQPGNLDTGTQIRQSLGGPVWPQMGLPEPQPDQSANDAQKSPSLFGFSLFGSQ